MIERKTPEDIKGITEVTIGNLVNTETYGKKSLFALESEYSNQNRMLVKDYCYDHNLSFEQEAYQHIFIDASRTSTLLSMNLTEDLAFYHRLQVEFHGHILQYLIALPLRSSIETFQLLLEIIRLDVKENYLGTDVIKSWRKELLVQSARLLYAKRIFQIEVPNFEEIFNLNVDKTLLPQKFELDYSRYEKEGLQITFNRYYRSFGTKKIKTFGNRISGMNREALSAFKTIFQDRCSKKTNIYLKDVEDMFNFLDEHYIESSQEEYQILEEIKRLELVTENEQLKKEIAKLLKKNKSEQALPIPIPSEDSPIEERDEDEDYEDEDEDEDYEGEEEEEDEETRALREEAREIFNS